jgi:cobalt transporter subunit CbtB
MFGLVMLYSVGFSTFTPTHNAAHDTACGTT